MEWHRIIVPRHGYESPSGISEPPEGNLPPNSSRLASLLRSFTATPDVCWFLQWIGFGDIPDELREGPQVRLPGREYLLFKGPVEAIDGGEFASIGEAPQMWWPEDRTWCVASEIDLKSTYIGGSVELVETLLGSEFEALRTTADARVDSKADRVNEGD
jgi:hypothetical protein